MCYNGILFFLVFLFEVLLLTWEHDTNTNNFGKLCEGRKAICEIFNFFFNFFNLCYIHVFANIPFWLNNEVPGAIYYKDFTELF